MALLISDETLDEQLETLFANAGMLGLRIPTGGNDHVVVGEHHSIPLEDVRQALIADLKAKGYEIVKIPQEVRECHNVLELTAVLAVAT